MWESIIKYGIDSDIGIFGVLFILLLALLWVGVWWIMKKNDEREKRLQARNEEREKRYIDVIDKQAEGLTAINNVQKDVSEMKSMLLRRN
ncbi:BhlA/UviB family holin-like peptide [Geomicrobium sediminis]|uniref:Tfp pilus assembly protein PilO n=1 Tax=Geomicrobium sediminis TaxID=1347788 RepID=A0ABS2P6R1_9BACL|nr:BhlA/UviB family holin-like peptide [Geomicrobium sediminis]MBM7631085.1 Tfp pilus assembly protein PilO [Geomicrobium sediminis]